MDQSQFASLTVIIAEVALALHPILIKQIPTGLPTQLLARLSTYSILAAILAGPKDWAASWGNLTTSANSLLFGAMNLVHIGSSYLSYQHLPAGSALALFYTYPFFNILAGVLFLGESFDWSLVPLLLLAFIGVLLISNYTKDGNGGDESKKKNIPLGIAASLVSALTETMIFMIAKTGKEPTAWLPMLRLYPGALAGLLGVIGTQGLAVDFSKSTWIPLILFNVFIGFLGYSLRFFSIPRLPTAIFSILTFIGVAAGYFWGLLYAKEVPSLGALGGAACITGALGVLKTLSKN